MKVIIIKASSAHHLQMRIENFLFQTKPIIVNLAYSIAGDEHYVLIIYRRSELSD